MKSVPHPPVPGGPVPGEGSCVGYKMFGIKKRKLMGSSASREAAAREREEDARFRERQQSGLIAMMRGNSSEASPEMRTQMLNLYSACQRSLEQTFRLGTHNSWTHRWRPFIQRYGPAPLGYRADTIEAQELYAQFLRMSEECQAMKLKYGHQQYQFVRSSEHPRAVPVRFASPLHPHQLRLESGALDRGEGAEDSPNKASEWQRHSLWRQLTRRVAPADPPGPSLAEDEEGRAHESQQLHSIDTIQPPVVRYDDPAPPAAPRRRPPRGMRGPGVRRPVMADEIDTVEALEDREDSISPVAEER